MSTLRRAGARWRLLVHEPGGVSHHVAHDPAFGGFTFETESLKNHHLPGTEFDELVVGRWLHIEQQDTGSVRAHFKRTITQFEHTGPWRPVDTDALSQPSTEETKR